ncbi:helix-turn-helix domain-containing protein [Paenibacillus polymyxa]|uniref:helix-turn-helix domain-containing protein n=1 Tax=Paenibacillus polymyxa TaxID=1406 RepID=UPI001F0D2E59|nr:helix-turn-helix transcriptional regulator [Paenibacillus polymyxa]UMR34006.1 helix-turn-helix domain-containing protein [Paenibacillus polymyxa]
MSKFGDFIKAARREGEYTLRELADKAEISFSQLSKIERGESSPTQSTIERLAYALNINKYELLALAGYLDAEIMEDLMAPVYERKAKLDPKIEFSHTHFSDYLLSWMMSTEDGLSIPQMKLLASELEDFYEVRKASIIKRGDIR